MRAILLSLALVVAVGASATAPKAADAEPVAETPDAFSLHIDIGRWGYMLSEVRDLALDATPENVAVSGADEELTQPHTLARSLRETVRDYNLLRSRMCAVNDLPQVTCGAAYAPAWLTEAPDASPSLAEIDRRSSAVGDVVMPFWDAVCARGRSNVSEEERPGVCPME